MAKTPPIIGDTLTSLSNPTRFSSAQTATWARNGVASRASSATFSDPSDRFRAAWRNRRWRSNAAGSQLSRAVSRIRTHAAALESAVSVKDRRRGRVEFTRFAIQFAQRNVDRSRQMAFAELPLAADVY